MKLDKNYKNPLYAKGEEMVVERSKDRVSNRRYTLNAHRGLTPRHFVRDPLFAARKEGGLGYLIKLSGTN